jgi:hypothetical protein
MKRAFALTAVVDLLLVAIIWHTAIKNFLWTHPWWHSFLVALPTIALPVLAYLELRHSGEANRLRAEANDLERQNARLAAQLDAERNKQLQQIVTKMERPLTLAEKNAAKLRRYIGANVPVTHGGNNCGTLQVVEVTDDNIATLFRPHGYASSTAWYRQVDCGRVQIVDVFQGSSPLQLTVLEWHGTPVELGEITKWEDRAKVAAKPTFPKGGPAYHAAYTKQGSSETRSMYVYMHRDGVNSFLLESSTGVPFVGNNEEVSKQFMVREVEYRVAGFERTSSGTSGVNPYRLAIW